jgi:hypothetical protein
MKNECFPYRSKSTITFLVRILAMPRYATKPEKGYLDQPAESHRIGFALTHSPGSHAGPSLLDI